MNLLSLLTYYSYVCNRHYIINVMSKRTNKDIDIFGTADLILCSTVLMGYQLSKFLCSQQIFHNLEDKTYFTYSHQIYYYAVLRKYFSFPELIFWVCINTEHISPRLWNMNIMLPCKGIPRLGMIPYMSKIASNDLFISRKCCVWFRYN